MKRMQAIVTGKKKQSSKHALPPDISGPLQVVDPLPTSKPPGTDANGGGGKDCAGVVKPGARSQQAGSRRPATSLESSPSLTRKGSASKNKATSPRREGSTKRPSSPSKARARHDLDENIKSSKSSTKQGLQQRLSKKSSSKDKKHKAGKGSAPVSPSIGGETNKRVGRSKSDVSKSPGDTSSKASDEEELSRPRSFAGGESGTEAGESRSISSTSSSHTAVSGHVNDTHGKQQPQQLQKQKTQETQGSSNAGIPPSLASDPRSRKPISSSASAPSPISPPGGSAEKPAPHHGMKSPSDAQLKAKMAPQPVPLQGILKDNKRNNSSRGGVAHSQKPHAQDAYAHDADGTQRQASSYNSRQQDGQGRSHPQPNGQSSRTPSRSNSLRGSSIDGVYSQLNYNTLPRGSELISPTSDNYGYSSLPRRGANRDAAHNSNHGHYHSKYNGYGSLSRSNDSDTLDQSFGSTGGSIYANYPPQHMSTSGSGRSQHSATSSDASKYASIGGRGRSQAGSSSSGQGYHPPRPDSVPPLGSNLSSSGDVFYDPARPGSVPPQHPNNAYAYNNGPYMERDRYAPVLSLHRAHRAGSVPIGYEADSNFYGPARAPGINHHEPESGPGHQLYHHANGGSSRAARGLRVHPGDERYRAGPDKRPIPRRHTVGTPHSTSTDTLTRKDSKTEQQREAFMQLLAQRYPQHADRIQGVPAARAAGDRTASSSSASPSPQPDNEKPARSRDVQRRRTAAVSYDPMHAAQSLEYDDLGTMSDLELPSFQRGGFMRTSLPMARSASTSLERPLGLVFLVCGDQTKKSLLPNEITTLDTVRALFVRAFPDLSLEMLESPRRKIYILDPATNIYFQLEDLAEIKDRSVLKLHETDSTEPQRVKERQEVRGRTVQMPQPRSQARQPVYEVPGGPDMFNKAQSLPPHPLAPHHHYQQDQWDPAGRRSRSRTPEPVERPRSLSAGSSSRQRISHSPDRMAAPGSALNPIPENRQFLPHHPSYRRDHQLPPPAPPPPLPRYYDPDDPAIYGMAGPLSGGGGAGGHYSLPNQPVLYDNAYHEGVYSVPPALAAAQQQQQTYVARSTRASPLAHPQRAVAPGPDMRDGSRSNSARQSPAYSPSPSDSGIYQQRQHPQAPAEDAASRNRIEKMEQQLATLTAWVHLQKAEKTEDTTGSVGLGPRRDVPPPPRSIGSLPSTESGSSEIFPGSTSSSTSDMTQGLLKQALGHSSSVSSVSRSDASTPVATLGAGMEARARLGELRTDLQVLRRQQQLNLEAIREELALTWSKIQEVVKAVPGAENQVLVHKRAKVTVSKGVYLSDKQQVDKELSDLEASVEEQREDVISRRCRVNIADVEGMALLLSNITKSLADLKARFPDVQSQMKEVMDAEMRVVVSEEKFLKAEPSEIERSLKRCKNLTQTLYTLKRLASAQDLQPPHIPNLAHTGTGTEDGELAGQKNAVLESIKAMIPDHQQRVEHMEAAEASRERKKKISTQQEALKFGKSLEMASKQLRPPSEQNQMEKEDVKDKVRTQKPVPENQEAVHGRPTSQTLKPPVAAKPVDLVSKVTPPATSLPYTSPSSSLSSSSSTTHTNSVPTTALTSPATSKSPFSSALTTQASVTSRVSEKPTATVSAMTAHVSDSITSTAAKTSRPDRLASSSSQGSSPGTPEKVIGSTVTGGTGTVTQTLYRVQTPVSQKGDADISTYQVCGPVNPVIPTSQAAVSRPSSLSGAGSSYNSLYGSPPGSEVDLATKDSFENPRSSMNGSALRPSLSSTSSSVSPTEESAPSKKPSVTFAKSASTIPSPPALNSPTKSHFHNNNNIITEGSLEEPHPEKADLATQKQAARSAFFSSLNFPPTSSASAPDRSSATLAPGPVLSPGVVGKVTPGTTINLVLAGSASPKSPTHPGTFTISPPTEIAIDTGTDFPKVAPEPGRKHFIAASSSLSPKKSPTLIPSRQASLDSHHPPSGPAPLASADTSSSSSESDSSGAKPKKVPPPPPPRKGSRPTSISGMPGLSSNSSPSHSSGEVPRFVGGILGQHRLSGGPLSSTPKSGTYQERPGPSRFERDIASGLCSNMNRPDLQSQKGSLQQMVNDAAKPNASNGSVVSEAGRGSRPTSSAHSIPPPPSVTLAEAGRQERGSSSESNSSGSGTSMGSQQSVVSVVRAQSMHGAMPVGAASPGRHGSKPAPPKRQSSLLAKLSGSNARTGRGADGKGVDF